MGYGKNAVKEYVIQIFKELKTKDDDYNFLFGEVFIEIKIDSKGDKNEYFPLTDILEDLRNKYLLLNHLKEVIDQKIMLENMN